MNTSELQTTVLTLIQSTGREGMNETITYLKGAATSFLWDATGITDMRDDRPDIRWRRAVIH